MSPAQAAAVHVALEQSLYLPASEFLASPGKRFRASLVSLGYRLGGGAKSAEGERRCEVAASIIERIHAGSLIVDDIQDGSTTRRNRPTLHCKYGVAKALNAGNWLYFAPLASLRDLGLSPADELALHRDSLDTLTKAHCGQALDIGVRVDEFSQHEVPALCRSSLEWKTGELMGLALRLGAYAAEALPEQRERLHSLGKELGIGLQMFDDAGNFAQSAAAPEKRHEDLRLRRPTWVWAFAALECSAAEYEAFRVAVQALPDESLLAAWTARNDFVRRLRMATRAELERALAGFREHDEAHHELLQFIEKLEEAYA